MTTLNSFFRPPMQYQVGPSGEIHFSVTVVPQVFNNQVVSWDLEIKGLLPSPFEANRAICEVVLDPWESEALQDFREALADAVRVDQAGRGPVLEILTSESTALSRKTHPRGAFCTKHASEFLSILIQIRISF
jgi:hypothetical protein